MPSITFDKEHTAQVYVEMEKEKPKKGDLGKVHEFEINNSTISNNVANKTDIPK